MKELHPVEIPIHIQVGGEYFRGDAARMLADELATALKDALAFMAAQLAADGFDGEPELDQVAIHWIGPHVGSVRAPDRAWSTHLLLDAVNRTWDAFAFPGRPAPAPVDDRHAPPAGVVLERPVKFRTTPRRFFEVLRRRHAAYNDDELRYYDELDQPHEAVAFRLRTHGRMRLEELHRRVTVDLDRRFPSDVYFYVFAATRSELADLIRLDRPALGAPLGGSPVRLDVTLDGLVWVPPGAELIVGCLRMPRVEIGTVIRDQEPAQLTVALRELAPLIDRSAFRVLAGVSWESYRDEWGADRITVTVYPFCVHRRVDARTLQVLYAERARGDGHDDIPLGGLVLLTRRVIEALPALPLFENSDEITEALPDTSQRGEWQVDWKGAYVSAWLPRDAFKLAAARHRPEARKLAAQIAAVLRKSEPGHHELRHLLVGAYGESELAIEASGDAFGFLLEQLEELAPKGTWVTRLYDASAAHDCRELLVRLASVTRYADHPAVRNAAAHIAATHAREAPHIYVPGRGVVMFGRWLLRVGEVLAEHDARYSVTRSRPFLTETGKARLGSLLATAGEAVIGKLVATGRELSKEEFSIALLDEVLTHLTPDDVEELEVQRSVRLVAVREEAIHGITRYFVTYQWAECVPGGPWTDVVDDRGQPIVREREHGAHEGFDELVFFLGYQRTAAVALAFEKALTYATAIWAAAELGLFALVPHASGFIAFNVVLYLGKAAFFGGEFTLDGLMLEVVKGYAMALGFQLFAPIGRFLGTWAAKTIGTKSIAAFLGGWLAQRVVSGAISGAGMMVVTQFATDLVLVAMGAKAGFSGWRDYLAAMTQGAKYGLYFEFGSALFQGLGRFESFQAAAAAARRAGWSPTKWWSELSAARAKLNDWLAVTAGKVQTLSLGELSSALHAEATELASAAWQGVQQAWMRRIITLSDVELTGLAASGLEKILEALEPHTAEPLLRELASRPAATRSFLELLGALDDSLVAMLANRGQLAALVGAWRLRVLLATGARQGLGVLDAFALDVAAAEQFLTELAQLPAQVRGVALFATVLRASPVLTAKLVQQLASGGLTSLGAAGFEKLLATLEARTAEPLLRALVADATATARLLDALGALDAQVVARLVHRGHLVALVRAPRLLGLLSVQPRAALGLLDAFGGDVAAAERLWAEAELLPASVRARGLRLFDGLLDAAPELTRRLVRQLGARLLVKVVPDGTMVIIAGELTISPAALTRLTEAELETLVRACENPAGHVAEIKRFEGGDFRFRFRSSVAARVDPWISKMLSEAGYAEGSSEAALFRELSATDKQDMWDLPGNRGKDPEIRPQATRWALGRQHTSVHQFVADFQFYVGEVARQQDLIEASLRAHANAELATVQATNGGRPLSDAQIEDVYRRVTQQPPAPNRQGGLGRAFPHLRGEGAKRAMRQRAIAEMGQAVAGGRLLGELEADVSAAEVRKQLTSDYPIRATRLEGELDPATLVEQLRARADSLHFSDLETAAYHVHVHLREVRRVDRIMGGNEVGTYLETAREGIRSGMAGKPTRRQDGAWSIGFSRGSGVTIVTVEPNGLAAIATYIPRASSL